MYKLCPLSLCLCLLSLLSAIKISNCVTVECIDSVEDFNHNKWKSDPAVLHVSNSKYLPSPFNDEVGLASDDGILYFEGNSEDPNKLVLKTSTMFEDERPAYIYIKYYAHINQSVTNQRAYVTPVLRWDGIKLQRLQLTSDFTWQEEYFEIHMNDIITEVSYALQIGIFDSEDGDYLFIDKIQIVQGIQIADISEFSNYCLGSNSTTTTTKPTTPPRTNATTLSDASTATTTSDDPETTESPPTKPDVLECVDKLVDLEYYDWHSVPHYRYAETSLDLPGIFQGKLIARDIFYFESLAGTGRPQDQVIFKIPQIFTSPAFLYLKYYYHSGSGAGNNSQSASAAGVEETVEEGDQAFVGPVLGLGSDEDIIKYLESSSDFTWREELVEIDMDDMDNYEIRIGLFARAPAEEFLFIDKIYFAQGIRIEDVNEIISLCSPAF